MNDGSGGDMDGEVPAGFAEPFFPHARLTALGVPVVFAGQIEEGVELIVRCDKDAAAVTAVAAVGSAFRNVLLPPKAHTPMPPVARLDEYLRSINEHDRPLYHKLPLSCIPHLEGVYPVSWPGEWSGGSDHALRQARGMLYRSAKQSEGEWEILNHARTHFERNC